jgi:hypothetical protein
MLLNVQTLMDRVEVNHQGSAFSVGTRTSSRFMPPKHAPLSKPDKQYHPKTAHTSNLGRNPNDDYQESFKVPKAPVGHKEFDQ